MIKDKLIWISLLLQISKRSHYDGDNNLYKTIWKNGNEEYNEKHIFCFFTIWNLISAITYKCGRVVLFLISVYFQISKAILIFSYSFHAPCIILPNDFFCYIVRSMFPFLFNWSQSKGGVVNQMSHLFFEALFFSNFLKIAIFIKLFGRSSTLKITALFWSHLVLLISTLK